MIKKKKNMFHRFSLFHTYKNREWESVNGLTTKSVPTWVQCFASLFLEVTYKVEAKSKAQEQQKQRQKSRSWQRNKAQAWFKARRKDWKA